LDTQKKIFVGFVIASCIYFSFEEWKQERLTENFSLGRIFSFINSHKTPSSSTNDSDLNGSIDRFSKNSPSNSTVLKTNIPNVTLYPIHSEIGNLKSYSISTQNLWKSWIQINPSLNYVNVPIEILEKKDLRTAFRRYSLSAGLDYIITGEIIIQNGNKLFIPIIYSKKDDQIYTGRSQSIFEHHPVENLQEALHSIYRMLERNLSDSNNKYSIESSSISKEKWLVSSDSWDKYISLIDKKNLRIPIDNSEWEAITEREPYFWLPWQESLLLNYKGREESFDLRYFLETFPKKYTNKYNFLLANLALQYAKENLKNKNKYQAVSLLELANSLFLSSNKTFSLEYADYLSTVGQIDFLEKNYKSALLNYMNAQEILVRIRLTSVDLFIQNKYELSKLYFQFGQMNLAIDEMQDSLLFEYKKSEFLENIDHYNLARSHFNLGTLNLMMGRKIESKKQLEASIGILQKNFLTSTDLMLQARTNLSAVYLELNELNLAIDNGNKILTDLNVLGIERSEYESKNLFNLSIAYHLKDGLETSKSMLSRYNLITPFSKIQTFGLDRKEYFPIITEQLLSPSRVFSDYEEALLRSYTGKYRIEGQTQEIRSRTYQDRLEDHDLFMVSLLRESGNSYPGMSQIKKELRINKEHESGNNVVFFDIGPAIGNLTQPAITSMSILGKFPNMDMVLIDLPSDVQFFLEKTESNARNNLISNPNIHIIQGDGTTNIKSWFERKDSWILKERNRPSTNGKLIIVRAANSIDIYEPSQKVMPFLESLVTDYPNESIVLLFNRSIFIKPPKQKKMQFIGSFSNRGYYHNSQSLDRQGEQAFYLSSLPIERRNH
jgi:hypothetical protein